MNVGYGFAIKERKPRQRHFIRTISPLGGKGDVQDESSWWVGVFAGDDDNGTRLGESPKSASQISPGWEFIEQVEDLLFGGARACDIKDIVIGELYDLSDALSGLCRRFRSPLAQSSV